MRRLRMCWARWEAVMFDEAGDVADELHASRLTLCLYDLHHQPYPLYQPPYPVH